jgi:hypothetical protein
MSAVPSSCPQSTTSPLSSKRTWLKRFRLVRVQLREIFGLRNYGAVKWFGVKSETLSHGGQSQTHTREHDGQLLCIHGCPT